MTVQLIGSAVMTSDRTRHQAKSVGQGNWVVSYLRGRTLTIEQATAAMRAAEEVSPTANVLRDYAGELGLTPAELFGMAAQDCDWPAAAPLPPCRPRVWFG